MSDWSQRKAWNNDGMDPDWRPDPSVFRSETERLKEENAKLRKALEFIAGRCLVPPDGGSPKLEDAVEAAKAALKK